MDQKDFTTLVIQLCKKRKDDKDDGDSVSSLYGSESPYLSEKEYDGDDENNSDYSEEDDTDDDSKSVAIESIIEKSRSIGCINDIIFIGNKYSAIEKRMRRKKFENKDEIVKMYKILDPLKKLDNMIGLDNVKKTIFSQLMYFINNLHGGKLDMLHTIIEGPPGVGKTELGHILCELYSSMGVLKKNKYVVASRSDLVGEYLGHTAVKTQKMIDKANGGVLFIDEAYMLGDTEHKDSFAKECVDTLNMNLTKNKHSMMCIIAGYEKELEECFFSMNEGLKRRFNFRLRIKEYSSENLADIFRLKVKESDWDLSKFVDTVYCSSFSKRIRVNSDFLEEILKICCFV